MKTILLLGELGKRFGRKHKFDIKSPAEAVRALVANYPEFERYMVESKIGYRVIVGKSPVGEIDDIHNPAGDTESIKIVPVMAGAKSGLGMVLIGAALIAASFFIPGGFVLYSASFAYGATYASIAFGLGAALALGGVAQMLSPTPKAVDMASSGATENNPSYTFDGPVNVSTQGNPVPIGYGRMIVGSAVISAGIVTEQI